MNSNKYKITGNIQVLIRWAIRTGSAGASGHSSMTSTTSQWCGTAVGLLQSRGSPDQQNSIFLVDLSYWSGLGLLLWPFEQLQEWSRSVPGNVSGHLPFDCCFHPGSEMEANYWDPYDCFFPNHFCLGCHRSNFLQFV